MQFPVFPQDYRIATGRLHLRPPSIEDTEALWPLVADARLTTYLAWEPHSDSSETGTMIAALSDAQVQGKGFHWLVLEADQVVGLVSLIDVRRTHRSWTWNRAELAYWIGTDHQKQGYATEASQAVLEFGFERLGFHRIVGYHVPENDSSEKVIQKLGFRLVGEEFEVFNKKGRWYNLRYYELLKADFVREDSNDQN